MTLFFLLLISGAIYCADKEEMEKKERLNVPPLDKSILKKAKNPNRYRRLTKDQITRIREKHMQQQNQEQRPASEPQGK